MKKTNALRQLDLLGISYTLLPYSYQEDQLDLDTIARENGLQLEQVFKTLVTLGETEAVVALVGGHSTLDLKRLASCSGNKRLQLAPIAQLPRLTGYVRGGCSPVGMKKELHVFIDEDAWMHEQIFVNAGSRGLLMCLSPDALLQACAGVRARIKQDAHDA